MERDIKWRRKQGNRSLCLEWTYIYMLVYAWKFQKYATQMVTVAVSGEGVLEDWRCVVKEIFVSAFTFIIFYTADFLTICIYHFFN